MKIISQKEWYSILAVYKFITFAEMVSESLADKKCDVYFN